LSQLPKRLPWLEVVVGERVVSRRISAAVAAECARKGYVHVPFLAQKREPFSAAQARNHALQKARGQFVFFWDVDLDCGANFWNLLKERLKSLKAPEFIMLPCLYLSKEGTMLWDRAPSIEPLRDSFLNKSSDWVLHLAICSSAVVLERQYALSLDGFRQNFTGHGFEDFEFLHRLALNNPWGPFPDDYPLDNPHRVPAQLSGFRAYLARYSFSEFFGELLLVHRFHSIPHSTRYYCARPNNRLQFYEYLSRTWDTPLKTIVTHSLQRQLHPELSFKEFVKIIACHNGIAHPESTGLFERELPRRTTFERMFRKFRKLVLQPRRFVRDASLMHRRIFENRSCQ